VNLILAGFNAAIFMIIKFNDLKHLTSSVDEIKKSIDSLDKKMVIDGERIAKIEGKCSVNHPD